MQGKVNLKDTRGRKLVGKICSSLSDPKDDDKRLYIHFHELE